MALTIRLSVSSGPEKVSWTGSPPVTIGRTDTNMVVLESEEVSREHAVVDIVEGTLSLIDKGSTGGTWLNMVRVDSAAPVPLVDRDLLQIGGFKLLLRVDGVDDDPPQIVDTQDDPSSRGGGTYATRASILIRLKSDGTLDRDLGWEAFAAFYTPVIAGFARNTGLGRQEVDDIIQDVLMGFFRVSNRFEYDPTKGRFRAYLKRITVNAIRSRYRKRSQESALPELFDPADPSRLEDVWDAQWTERLLERAMETVQTTVAHRTWQAFELHGHRGVPCKAAAEELNMSPESVRHGKMRVAKAIREEFLRLRDLEG